MDGEDLKRCIQRVLDGDTDAFALLVDEYRGRVLACARRHAPPQHAEEIAQDAFVDAFKSLGTFAHRSPFEHWLLRITLRRCCDFWRGRGRQRETSLSGLSERQREWVEQRSASKAESVFQDALQQESAREVLDAILARLPAPDRILLALVHFEGYSAREAAALMGWSTAAAKMRASRARRKARRLLEGMLDEE